jgi:ABC-type transport system involved in multi-copper enzyme maturation permease subunit
VISRRDPAAALASTPARAIPEIRRRDQVIAIAGKEISDAVRTRLVIIVTGFLLAAALVALVVAALGLQAQVTAYISARDMLLALGKSAAAIVPPAFFPLKLLRGFIEHIEIIGAVLGLVLGYRAAAIERGRNTLALLLTRPITQASFLSGKLLGNAVLIYAGLALVFAIGSTGIILLSGIGLAAEEILRILIVYGVAGLYVCGFFMFGLMLALHARRLPNALLLAFTVWLALVLIAPQIGDTLDPDNQAAVGIFKQLGIAKLQEREILASFRTYETVRDGIEQLSPAKHFERLSFALLGIKDIYNGQPTSTILRDRSVDLVWLVVLVTLLMFVLFGRRIDFAQLSRE